MRQLLLLLCFCTLLSVSLAGCGGNKSIKDAPYQDVPLEDAAGNDLHGANAKRLYEAGHEYLYNGEPKKALRVYSDLQARFPFSHYETQAAMETVTAYYLQKDYAKAVSAADRFIKQHPRHPHVDYLYYLRGLANFHRNDPTLLSGNTDTRDLTYLRQAFSDFRLLIRNFPNSVYAKDAQLHMIDIRNRLAQFDLSIAEFYLKRHAYVAAARRASYIVEHYQRTSSTPRALEIMQESYIQLGLTALARDTRSVLQASYPDYILNRDEFYRKRAHKENQNPNNEGPLAWLWPWSNANKNKNLSKEWLGPKPAAIVGQPSTVPSSGESSEGSTNNKSEAGSSGEKSKSKKGAGLLDFTGPSKTGVKQGNALMNGKPPNAAALPNNTIPSKTKPANKNNANQGSGEGESGSQNQTSEQHHKEKPTKNRWLEPIPAKAI